jgi:hypothetical protein
MSATVPSAAQRAVGLPARACWWPARGAAGHQHPADGVWKGQQQQPASKPVCPVRVMCTSGSHVHSTAPCWSCVSLSFHQPHLADTDVTHPPPLTHPTHHTPATHPPHTRHTPSSALLSRVYNAASPFLEGGDLLTLDPPRTSFAPADFLLYCYYGGMVCIGKWWREGRWTGAGEMQGLGGQVAQCTVLSRKERQPGQSFCLCGQPTGALSVSAMSPERLHHAHPTSPSCLDLRPLCCPPLAGLPGCRPSALPPCPGAAAGGAHSSYGCVQRHHAGRLQEVCAGGPAAQR